MEEKLENLYKQCIEELNSIRINVLDVKENGIIEIKISKRNNKRYGCCVQEDPDKKTRYIEKIGNKRFVRYSKYNKHTIEISKWVMELDDKIIKNTIIHEIIHCFPSCNNHGNEFKQYSKYINEKLGYEISRVGNKKEDYKKSNIDYNEENQYKYKIYCEKCKQIFFRKRLIKNFETKYRCGKCNSKFVIYKILT